MIKLPDRATDEGAETRVLLAECRGPSFAAYTLALATECMQLMDLVLWNRVDNPKPFLANDHTLLAVIRARGQFKGFEHYPNYDAGIVHNIQQLVDIANDPKDKRSAEFADFINAAVNIANSQTTIANPATDPITAWRTANSGSPGSGFTFFRTVFGTDFYSFG